MATQTMRFSNAELEIFKSIFADSEDDKIFKIVRKAILQLPMDAVELSLVETVFRNNPSNAAVVRKMFIPEIDGNAPLHQVTDPWFSFAPKIEDVPMEKASAYIGARVKIIEYLNQQFDFLIKGTQQKIKFGDDLKDGLERQDLDSIMSSVIMRNFIIGYTEQRLMEIKMLAGKKDETPEETIKRLHQNSNK